MKFMEQEGLYCIKLNKKQLKYIIELVKRDTDTIRLISKMTRLCDIEDIPFEELLEVEKSCLLGEELLSSWTNMEE